jgi:hypothetical protein
MKPNKLKPVQRKPIERLKKSLLTIKRYFFPSASFVFDNYQQIEMCIEENKKALKL